MFCNYRSGLVKTCTESVRPLYPPQSTKAIGKQVECRVWIDEILFKGGCENRLKYSVQTSTLRIITGEYGKAKQYGT